MQSSLTSYFKAKKRVREDLSSQKTSASKLLALSSPTPASASPSPSTPTSSGGRTRIEPSLRTESPIPVNANPDESTTESESSTIDTTLNSSTSSLADIKPISTEEKTPTPTPTVTPTLREKLQAQRAQQQALLDKLRASRVYTNVNAEKLLTSPTKKPKPISEKEFYSPKTQQDIFTSPIRLSEIKSPLKLSPANRAVAKRLFNALSKSPTKASEKGQERDEGETAVPKKIPAYQRFHHLAQKTHEEIGPSPSTSSTPQLPVPIPKQKDAGKSQIAHAPKEESKSKQADTSSQLHLPYKFKVLEELFYAVETVAAILYNRKETITFAKVQPGVHEIMRRVQLQEKHLEQIMTVFPDAYNVELDQHKSTNMAGVQKVTYQLIMRINLKCTSSIGDSFTPSVIAERRKIFHENLLKICHKHHQEFLSTLQPPIKIPPGKTVTRWHPRFRLDEVPDIQPEKNLPKPPEAPSSANNAKAVIAKAQNILDNANPRMKKALAELLKAKTPIAPTSSQNQSTGTTETTTSSASTQVNTLKPQDNKTKHTLAALKGVSQSLIDKIHAREQEKAIRAMTLTPEEDKNRIMMNRLPDFVKSVRNILVAEKKSALPLCLLVERLRHSKDGAMKPHEIEDHIRLLCKTLPSWASLLKLSGGEYVKINKDKNINDLLEQFSERLKNNSK